MNGLQIFTSPAFGSVRTLTENGKTLFCGADIAKPLAYKNPYKAISDHCPHVTKRYIGVQTGTKADGSPAMQEIEMAFIPEGDVYRLIARSRLPEAQRFESWIFDEVVPSIRKHGAYMTPETLEAALLNPDFLIQLAGRLKEEQEKNRTLQAKIDADAPKVLYADTVAGSKTGMLIREFCKFLKGRARTSGKSGCSPTCGNADSSSRRKAATATNPPRKPLTWGFSRSRRQRSPSPTARPSRAQRRF